MSLRLRRDVSGCSDTQDLAGGGKGDAKTSNQRPRCGPGGSLGGNQRVASIQGSSPWPASGGGVVTDGTTQGAYMAKA